MATPRGGRKRWTDRREAREPSLYDEWLKQENAVNQIPDRRRENTLRHGDTAASNSPSSGTIRAVTPEETANADGAVDTASEGSPKVLERGTPKSEHSKPRATTAGGGGSATVGEAATRPKSAPKPRKLVKERTPGSRNGASSTSTPARNSSKSNGAHALDRTTDKPLKSSRSRTKTLEDPRNEPSPTNIPLRSAERNGSMNVPTSPSSGAEYLASVPAETSPPLAPSVQTIGVGGQNPLDSTVERSISPDTLSTAVKSKTSSQRDLSARRILHLMRTLNGRYSGTVLFRRNTDTAWNQMHCHIQESSGDLVYEPRGFDGVFRTLLSGLRGCSVRPSVDGETPYLVISLPQLDTEVHLKLLTQVDFDSWYAALLYWQSLGPRGSSLSNGTRASTDTADTTTRPEVPPRASSARKRRDRTGTSKSERKKAAANAPSEAPVIKIGRMIYWEDGIPFDTAGSVSGVSSQEDSRRPQVYRATQEDSRRPPIARTQSHLSRSWRWANGQLRENGELKLHSEGDNNLMSVVQLSQLSRCAIQRLHRSVMEDEFCIAIYPQYTSIPSDSQASLIRPIFLSLENRVLYEVWFVLLRAFTIPQLYGPRIASEEEDENNEAEVETSQDLENMLATRTTDMFRMERSLSIKIIEAKMYTSTTRATTPETISNADSSKGGSAASSRPEQQGYYAEVLLDNETRGKTTVKFEGLSPLWSEGFEFLDLPPVLSSASVVVKRRSPEGHVRESQGARRLHDESEPHGGSAGLESDVVCGKVEIYLQELEGEKEMEKWWPVVNMYNQRVGEMLIKARAEEGVILMSRDYQPLSDVLHRFGNGISVQIAQMVPSELKRVSDCLLNVYQVSGKAADWIMSLAEEEIDGIHKETPISRVRFDRRVGSDSGLDAFPVGSATSDRELIVRDMNKTATFEANLLFRGNTLLTKSLDTHMRRVGKEYLEESLGAKLRVINGKDPDCEVDPNRVASQHDMDKNWRRLLLCTEEVWKAIVAARSQCPIELRLIFRHIRACAEDRYGDFLRSVSYSSVSGFLFLRFFCPAVLNPKLFGLLKDDIKPRARRSFTLIAKSLQTLANMASFGSKEKWMEPMNAFLTQHRADFKSFIDEVCYVPTPLSAATSTNTVGVSTSYPPEVMSTEVNLSYNTPITVMQRLPPTSREGFPSLPFLIDQPRAYADLVQLWLEAISGPQSSTETGSSMQPPTDIMSAITDAGGDLVAFHEICTSLHRRTQDCLNRAERAERPNSASSFKWDELIDQLQTDGNEQSHAGNGDELPTQASFDILADHLAGDPSMAPETRNREWDVLTDMDDARRNEQQRTSTAQARQRATSDFVTSGDRPPSSGGVIITLREGLRRVRLDSRGSDSASANVSNTSSAVSSDTEHTTGTTALPSYDRELRHRERREAAKQQIKQHVQASKSKEAEKDKRKTRAPIVSALRKKNQRESKTNNVEGYTSYGI